MKKSTVLIFIVLFVLGLVLTAHAYDSELPLFRQAAGKTTLSAEACGVRAKLALESMGLKNIKIVHTLKDWQKVKTPDSNTPRTVEGDDGSTRYSIFCNIFSSDIVMFTVVGPNTNRLREMWDTFYSK